MSGARGQAHPPPTMTSATGKRGPSAFSRGDARGHLRAGFTLVELLSVVAIMAIIMGALGYSISNMGGPSSQVAAGQVASGMSLARQYAVAKNLETRFIICNLASADGDGLPPESWRYWTVIQTNRDSNTWTMLKEWEKLPAGVVFLNIAADNYNSRRNVGIQGASLGDVVPTTFSTSIADGQEWTVFQSFTTDEMKVEVGTNPLTSKSFTLKTNTPGLGYIGVGETVRANGRRLSSQMLAVRVAPGAVNPANQIVLKSTNNFFYIDSNRRGSIRVRSPESYSGEP